MLSTTQRNPPNPTVTKEAEENEEKEICEISGDLEEEDDFSDSGSESGNGPATLSDNIIFMLDDIAHIISSLYNLSVAMRQPAPQDRLQNVESYAGKVLYC